MSDERIDVLFGAKISELLGGLSEANTAVRESVDGMKEQLESLNTVAEHLRTAFLAITVALAGGEMFEATIEKTSQLGVQLEVMHAKTGAAVEDLSRLAYAANVSHVSFEELDVGLQRLARNLEMAATGGSKQVSDALKALGLSATDSQGKLRSLPDMLVDIAGKFQTMPDGTTKTAIAMDLFGRSGAQLIPMLDRGKAGMQEMMAQSDALGNTMTEKGVKSAVQYEDAMVRFHAAIDGLGRSIATSLMPSLSNLADELTKNASDAHKAENGFSGLKSAIDFLARAALALQAALFAAYQAWTVLWTAIRTLGNGTAISAAFVTAAQNITDFNDKLDITYRKLMGLYSMPHPSIADDGTGMGTPTFGGAKDKGGDPRQYLLDQMLKNWQERQRISAQESKKVLEILKQFRAEEQKINLEADATAQGHLGKMLAANQKVWADMGKAGKKFLDDTAQQWQQTFSVITETIQKSFDGVIQGTQTVRQAWAGLFRNLTLEALSAELSMLKNHAAMWLARHQITLAGVGEEVALNAWSALQAVAGFAAEAAAASWAAIAGIPFVGPFLAPAVAGATLAGVLALGNTIRSAAGGYDIPAGVNPMTQLHAQEMVLPADLANRVRGMTDGGGGGVHLHVHSPDAKGVKEFFDTNSHHVARVVQQAVKDGRIRPT